MKCPDCKAKIKQTDFDPVFEWFECPKCQGGFTYAEILEGEQDAGEDRRKQGNRGGSQAAKARGSRSTKRKDSTDESAGASARNGKGPVAKGKKRRTEIAADEEAGEEQIEAIAAQTVKTDQPKHHRDEIPTGQVVNIMADEIQEIYHELGGEIDELNAREKALVIWREIHYKGHVTAREQNVLAVLCKEHRE